MTPMTVVMRMTDADYRPRLKVEMFTHLQALARAPVMEEYPDDVLSDD